MLSDDEVLAIYNDARARRIDSMLRRGDPMSRASRDATVAGIRAAAKAIGGPVRYENLPRRPAPALALLCAAMYDVCGDVWSLIEGDLSWLSPRSRRADAALYRQKIDDLQRRAEYLCKRCYGDGWEDVFLELTQDPSKWAHLFNDKTKGRAKGARRRAAKRRDETA